jgi:RNA polymerase sigma-70 factor (ECF subfamily)
VALSEIDRNLLERCLQHKPRAWEDFVDRFMGLVVHVIHHTARTRSIRLTPADRDDLCAEVFLTAVKNDFALLRNFHGKSSLATYLTVVTRRIVVKEMLARLSNIKPSDSMPSNTTIEPADPRPSVEEQVSNQEQVQRMLNTLHGAEAQVVCMYHLEGKSYQEISTVVGVPENSIGPMLHRARGKMRSAGGDSAN